MNCGNRRRHPELVVDLELKSSSKEVLGEKEGRRSPKYLCYTSCNQSSADPCFNSSTSNDSSIMVFIEIVIDP